MDRQSGTAAIPESIRNWIRDAQTERASLLERETQRRREFAERFLVPAILQNIPTVSIWIFGSVARGEATKESDIDVLTVCDDAWKSMRWQERLTFAENAKDEAFKKSGISLPCDLAIWTGEEWEEEKKKGNPFALSICRDGRKVYG